MSTTLGSDTINDIDTTYQYALQQAVLLTMHRSNKTPASCTAETVVKEAHKFLAFLSGLTEDTTPGELREARGTIANLNREVAHLERESADLQYLVEQLQRERDEARNDSVANMHRAAGLQRLVDGHVQA